MIRKLRKKFIVVLMAVVCLFLVGILAGLFITAKTDFERRSFSAFQKPPARDQQDDTAREPGKIDMPIAIGRVSAEGEVTIQQNQIYYLDDAALTTVLQNLTTQPEDNGLTSAYDLRYHRRTDTDGSAVYFLTDTIMERSALNAQLLYSAVIGVGAIGAFFLVSMLLSRWMIRPVETAWEKQRQFVADASHELKTPLTVVLSNTDMVLASHAVTDEKNRMRLENIQAEAQRMKGLVENLLALARADSRPAPTACEAVNLSYLVTSATLTMEPAVYDQGRTLDCQAAENLTVTGDPTRLRQMVEILLDNAGKYGEPGSPIRVRLEAVGKKELQLTVASEGAPLPPEECRNIFERFYRSDKSRGEQKGYGLGLAIAQSIVQEHGGRIWAQSDGVRVNTFYVRLPGTEPARQSGV